MSMFVKYVKERNMYYIALLHVNRLYYHFCLKVAMFNVIHLKDSICHLDSHIINQYLMTTSDTVPVCVVQVNIRASLTY